jgi:two-component system, chemotaxis family, sensor kinase CheA
LQTQQAARSMAGESSIRVDVSLLDKVMNLVGELVLTRNQLSQFSSTLKHAGLHKTSQRLNSITMELQAGVMKTRMQPIDTVWSKFPRAVRDVATACGKQVRIEMEGKDTELDKSIIESIKDPLTHLVRNCVDHGVELPAKRQAAGKSPEGCVTLRAYHEGGHVNIEISDDGAGLDCAKIRAKAVQRGLVAAEQSAQMSEREVINLIFAPGFSTAEKITSVSGRGVGMDVVKTNIEKIGGTVDVQTKLGGGTTIKMKIPLTLAIVPALIVTCAGDRYAIPQVSLLELVRIDKQTRGTAIEYVHGAPVYRLRERLLPLVYLDQALRLQREAQADAMTVSTNIVVLQSDERVFGLVVDRVNDTEEIVVKPLGQIVKVIAAFAGATIMGDGSVALILDVRGIANAANILGEARNAMKVEIGKAVSTKNAGTQTLLLVRLASGGHAAIPLAMIERLEEFPTKALEKIGAQQVVQYRAMAMPLWVLDALLEERRSRARVRGTAPKIPTESISVVVCGEPRSQIGLMVDRILDVVNEPSTTRGASTRHGVLGTQIIRERVTEILDLSNILRSVRQHTQRAREAVVVGA